MPADPRSEIGPGAPRAVNLAGAGQDPPEPPASADPQLSGQQLAGARALVRAVMVLYEWKRNDYVPAEARDMIDRHLFAKAQELDALIGRA